MPDSTSERPAWETPAYDPGTFSEEPGPAELSDDWATTQLEPIRVPTPEQEGKRRVWLVAVIVVLIIGVFGAAMGLFAAVNQRRAAIDASLVAGGCVKLSEDGGPGIVNYQTADCGKSISYTVATVADGDVNCPENSYHSLSITSGNRIVKTACLIQNLQINACYKTTGTIDKLAKVECTDTSADFRVALRTDTVNDQTLCISSQRYYGFSNPPRTYCLAPPIG